jgi:hypothetical protein
VEDDISWERYVGVGGPVILEGEFFLHLGDYVFFFFFEFLRFEQRKGSEHPFKDASFGQF